MITVVINNELHENIDVNATDEYGNPIYPELQDPVKLRQGLISALIWLQNQRVRKVLTRYDYLDIGDLLDTANDANDPDSAEATAILSWYREYYTQIDNQTAVIQNTLDADLPNIDVKALEKQAYDSAVSVAPLP